MGQKKIFDIMVENFPHLAKDIYRYQKISKQNKYKVNYAWAHESQTVKNQTQKNLKAARAKCHFAYRKTLIPKFFRLKEDDARQELGFSGRREEHAAW